MNRNQCSLCSLLLLAASLSGCESGAPPEPESRREPERQGAGRTQKAVEKDTNDQERSRKAQLERAQQRAQQLKKRAAKKVEAQPAADVPVAEGDPEKGEFTLEEATKGLPKEGHLVAELDTGKGKLTCKLYDDKAPITVANFVGLARGLRPWKKDGKWVKEPLYDGTPFHRVIPGFMIQGGDPEGTGAGGPGYVIPDEIWENAHHDRAGLLCMANRGKNTNGSQFFIMDGAAPHLDRGYTIFGECQPETVIKAIAGVERRGDRAKDPVKLNKVTIKRVPEAG